MSLWGKAISLAVAFAGEHPWVALLLAVAAVTALRGLGIVPDGDWWGTGREIR